MSASSRRKNAAGVLGGAIVDDFPLLEDVHVLADDPVELLLNNSWRPASGGDRAGRACHP